MSGPATLTAWDRFVDHGLIGLLLMSWAATTLGSNTLPTSAAFAVLLRNGGTPWIWGVLILGAAHLSGVLSGWLWLRILSSAGVFFFCSMVAVMVALSSGPIRPTIGTLVPVGLFALLPLTRLVKRRRRTAQGDLHV